MTISRAPILSLALGLDWLLGDPPNHFHPVAWMGSLIAYTQRYRPHRGPFSDLVFGACISLTGGLTIALLGGLLDRLLSRLRPPLNWLGEAILLKSTLSLRGLDRAAREVEAALDVDDLPAARRSLAWHLVSRDTGGLDSSQVAAATIESVAENSSDGVLAPLFYYAVGGLPLALAYRFVNTADSMLGYHSPTLEWRGKFAARLDDLLNFLPARLTGLLIVLAAPLCNADALQAWRTLQRDARQTQSPNAGYPMSAIAGALGVELEKINHYRLGGGGRKPGVNDIRRARRLMFFTIALGAASLAGLAHYCKRLRLT